MLLLEVEIGEVLLELSWPVLCSPGSGVDIFVCRAICFTAWRDHQTDMLCEKGATEVLSYHSTGSGDNEQVTQHCREVTLLDCPLRRYSGRWGVSDCKADFEGTKIRPQSLHELGARPVQASCRGFHASDEQALLSQDRQNLGAIMPQSITTALKNPLSS